MTALERRLQPHLNYLRYVVRHKTFVFVAGLRTGVPLWRLLIHDLSKFSRSEWGPYVRRFYAGRSGGLDKAADPADFHRAWTHHWHRNPHHWEHWLVFDDSGGLYPIPMPEQFAREMVADWMGAGRAITGRWDIGEWYASNRHRIRLHPDTEWLVDDLLVDVLP